MTTCALLVLTLNPFERLVAQTTDDNPTDVLTAGQWRQVDAAVDRALKWLATQQRDDGSFKTVEYGQPGITSLCVMAFLSRGHLPGEGPNGERLQRAIQYILESQKRSGLIARVGPDAPGPTHNVAHQISTSAVYNHAISGLTLTEVYAVTALDMASRIESCVEPAL